MVVNTLPNSLANVYGEGESNHMKSSSHEHEIHDHEVYVHDSLILLCIQKK